MKTTLKMVISLAFVVLQPSINSSILLLGPGSGPMLEAAAAWEGVAASLESERHLGRSSADSDTAGPRAAALFTTPARGELLFDGAGENRTPIVRPHEEPHLLP